MTVKDRIVAHVEKHPGQTEQEISAALFGHGSGYQQRVNSSCRSLIKGGYIKRLGEGGQSDPFRYTLTGKKHA